MVSPIDDYPGAYDAHDYTREAAEEISRQMDADPTYLPRQIGRLLAHLRPEECMHLGDRIEYALAKDNVTLQAVVQKELTLKHIAELARELYMDDMSAFARLIDRLDDPDPLG